MSKGQLIQRVLADSNLSIYACGREDIRSGVIDRRILATLEYLVARGYDLTITSLNCGHSVMTASGNVSEHSIGSAMDIAAINGQPIIGNQGPGTLADSMVRDLLQLQGSMKPHQIISLMDYFGADNTFAMARPRRPRPRRLRRRGLRVGLEAVQPDPQGLAVGASDRPPRRDRQPRGPDEAFGLRAAGR